MPQDTAKVKDLPEQSPVSQARTKLGAALERLESTVLARMEEAQRASAAAQTAASQNNGDSDQWQNACRLLEEQLASLKDENSQLHSELHQLREQAASLQKRNAALEDAKKHATAALDDAIASVETLLKGA